MLEVGSEVIADVAIEEPGFDGDGFYFHANPGEVGQVLAVLDGGWLTVAWSRSTSDVAPHEVRPIDRGVNAPASQP